MHSLRDYVVKRDCSLSGILFFSAVIFTRAPFSEESPEWHPWQHINSLIFKRRPISASIKDILKKAHEHVRSKAGRYSWYRDQDSRPSEGQIRRVSNLLRDNFEYSTSPRTNVEEIERCIKHVTQEQFEALDLLQDNRRLVFKGPAGTGKTFLAMESAFRATHEGKSVLFLCFNNLLGDWLKAEVSSVSGDKSRFRCGTFHSLLMEISGERRPRDEPEYWQKYLLLQAAEKLLQDDRTYPHFDVLIVDEAQDLMRDEYLDVLDLVLKDGLAGGQWALFWDFERQAIYSPEDIAATTRGLQYIGSSRNSVGKSA
ncbi:MAG: DEAD/DEAH box helicase family protein [Sterolibacteriaceae bacterium]|uniref:DEAD/DEAH box helicase family protein n=1 Tax=Candidatus Methylophosphatis roskildensis TaxID=2899263 RepID=A0A9D7E510_9PROT|nr:DEAD/DEAH box helicase family protein [Candidatus Methylophosphatis roskildensis]